MIAAAALELRQVPKNPFMSCCVYRERTKDSIKEKMTETKMVA